MAARISGSVGSYESGAKNNTADIKTVQTLLTAAAKNRHKPVFDPNGIDGKISRTASRSGTVKAIGNFQKLEVRMNHADFRIDVNGNTWKKLVAAAGTAAIAPTPPPLPQGPVAGLITLTVCHGNKIPTQTSGLTATEQTRFESTFTLTGGMNGSFSGSIYPDNMNVKGRVIDGTYPLHIGFHKGGTAAKQTASDLVYKKTGVRPGLLVNARSAVPVYSLLPSKTTSQGINVHNGFSPNRGSDGCLTIPHAEFKTFIEKFLGAYPNLADWQTFGNNTGKKIGSLIIKV